MAKIGIENISEILLNVIPSERRFDSTGGLAIDESVRRCYQSKNYDAMPKSREEADARGLMHFNGLTSSFPSIRVYNSESGAVVSADIAPTRYLIGQAMRDVVKEGHFSGEEASRLSPDMANVSIIAPVKIKGEYFLLSQLKGKALGSGEFLAGIAAGNVDGKYLSHKSPLVTALQNECSEELGLDLSRLDSTSFVFMIDERETGQVNFASVARGANIDRILRAYEAKTMSEIASSSELEVAALASLPITGIAMVPLEKEKRMLRHVKTYYPSSKGLSVKYTDAPARPYTSAVAGYLSKPENVKFLLEKAGF